MKTPRIFIPFCLVFLFGCDSSRARNAGQQAGFGRNSIGQNTGQAAGQNAGQSNGRNAGQVAGPNSGQGTGENAGQGAGENAGQGAGQNAGQGAGENVGQNAGQGAGQNTGQNASTASVGYGIYSPELAKEGLGGQLAKEGQFPYLVALAIDLGNKEFGICGGGLIGIPKNGRTVYAVLTAAHCFDKFRKNGKVKLTMGTTDTDTDHQSSTAKTVTVTNENIIQHPKYNKKSNVNDIAVIRLPSTFKLSSGISTLPIPDAGQGNRDWSGIPIIFAGWGDSSFHSKSDNTKLVFFTTKTMKDEECADAIGESDNDQTMICLDGKNMKAVCEGDSGGPVVWRNAQDKPLQIIGVASYRIGKCKGETPTYHTRVAAYVNWIKQNV